ncbi:hypothetical protein WJX73_009773 [Symbiochloris irregularis]|uniref:N-end aminoacyl transferase N-terminal domain-containing protein n=1 Tax=Symbiochloris irregularis TaxID=706552 RepID=A0AAW1NVX1_9CHLO
MTQILAVESDALSLIQYLDSHSSSCGYCRGDETSHSLGFVVRELSVDQYQCLMERGWRRSGCYVYHPLNHETCCPQYTIRMEAQAFQPTKEQRRVRRKFDRDTAALSAPEQNRTGLWRRTPLCLLKSEFTQRCRRATIWRPQ